QEELYVGLEGEGWMEIDGERVTLGPREVIFVPPGVSRTTVAGPGGLTFLAVGAVPHDGHEPNRKFDG
ncbi:MAG: cupin domain-containing protein, partial [Miltoncostaeaceae bacterium]